MRIVLSGGNGYLGRGLAERWVEAGWEVVVLTRSPGAGGFRQGSRQIGVEVAQEDDPPFGVQAGCPPCKIREVFWDGETLGDWAAEIDGADVLVNLAGRSVNCRYNDFNKGVILSSRVDSTRVLGEAVSQCARPPRVWLNSSTATIYRHAEDRAMDDETGEIGSGFSVDVATAWEREFFSSSPVGVRKVALRTAMVMGRGDGGPFSVFETLVRRGLGGRMGDGRQMVSWVHFEDFARAIEFLIASDFSGTINVCAPGPLRNDAFMKEICDVMGVKVALPSPRWLLEIGALVIGTETELPLKSRWVVPSRLLGLGFEFKYQTWPQGVRGILGAGSGGKGAGK